MTDYRTFDEWKMAGRTVMKGEHSHAHNKWNEAVFEKGQTKELSDGAYVAMFGTLDDPVDDLATLEEFDDLMDGPL